MFLYVFVLLFVFFFLDYGWWWWWWWWWWCSSARSSCAWQWSTQCLDGHPRCLGMVDGCGSCIRSTCPPHMPGLESKCLLGLNISYSIHLKLCHHLSHWQLPFYDFSAYSLFMSYEDHLHICIYIYTYIHIYIYRWAIQIWLYAYIYIDQQVYHRDHRASMTAIAQHSSAPLSVEVHLPSWRRGANGEVLGYRQLGRSSWWSTSRRARRGAWPISTGSLLGFFFFRSPGEI